MGKSLIRVLVVEDHEHSRAGICDYLLSQGMDVKEASSTAEATQLIEGWTPHVVVLDIVIPSQAGEKVDWHHGDGIRAAWLIKECHPDIGIVFLSNYPWYRPEVLDIVKSYGGLVYLVKAEGPPDELRGAIYQALEGRVVLDPRVIQGGTCWPDEMGGSLTEQQRDRMEYAVNQMNKLTEREQQVVELVVAARTNGGIAKELCISPSAVQTHLNHVYAKVGLNEIGEGAALDKRALLTKAYTVYRSRYVQSR